MPAAEIGFSQRSRTLDCSMTQLVREREENISRIPPIDLFETEAEMMEDSITERTGLIRRTTLGRNDIQRDHATNLAQQTGEGGDGLPPLPPSGGGKFKKVSTLVIAMNRFKCESSFHVCQFRTSATRYLRSYTPPVFTSRIHLESTKYSSNAYSRFLFTVQPP